MVKVRVFIDHANFDIGWRERIGRGRDHRMSWETLPTLIMRGLRSIELIQGADLDLRGLSVYASLHPEPSEKHDRFERWLRNDLDQMPGYTVKYSYRQKRLERCEQGHETVHFVEKGVDTKIACDMLSLAMRDLYDIGVIVSDDSDLVPSVECVQDILDKQIVHLGFRQQGNMLRSAAWSHLMLDSMVPELLAKAPA